MPVHFWSIQSGKLEGGIKKDDVHIAISLVETIIGDTRSLYKISFTVGADSFEATVNDSRFSDLFKSVQELEQQLCASRAIKVLDRLEVALNEYLAPVGEGTLADINARHI